MVTLINALNNIVGFPANKIAKVVKSGTRINIVGDSLEDYIKNAFSNTFTLQPGASKEQIYSQIFSWQGNQNNPPDLILKGYDAIEVKKIEGTGAIALNSSFPHATIGSASNMITANCRICEAEPWVKDVLYAIGTVADDLIKYLFFVYGDLYAANSDVYEKIRLKIKEGVLEIPDVDFSSTNELGKVKRVDPLGITDLRIRGMWSIKHPFQVYSYLPQMTVAQGARYTIFALMSKEKYHSFDVNDISSLLSNKAVTKFDVLVKSPNNPAILIDAILIKISL